MEPGYPIPEIHKNTDHPRLALQITKQRPNMCTGRHLVWWCKSRRNPACSRTVKHYDENKKQWEFRTKSLDQSETLEKCCGGHADSDYTCLYCPKNGGFKREDFYHDVCDGCKPFYDAKQKMQEKEPQIERLRQARALSTQEVQQLFAIEAEIRTLREVMEKWMDEGRRKIQEVQDLNKA